MRIWKSEFDCDEGSVISLISQVDISLKYRSGISFTHSIDRVSNQRKFEACKLVQEEERHQRLEDRRSMCEGFNLRKLSTFLDRLPKWAGQRCFMRQYCLCSQYIGFFTVLFEILVHNTKYVASRSILATKAMIEIMQ